MAKLVSLTPEQKLRGMAKAETKIEELDLALADAKEAVRAIRLNLKAAVVDLRAMARGEPLFDGSPEATDQDGAKK
jgi:hypothetical protein